MNDQSHGEGLALPEGVDPAFPFWVVEKEDGSFDLHWDPCHRVTSVFNDWTERDFVDMLTEKANAVISSISESVTT